MGTILSIIIAMLCSLTGTIIDEDNIIRYLDGTHESVSEFVENNVNIFVEKYCHETGDVFHASSVEYKAVVYV